MRSNSRLRAQEDEEEKRKQKSAGVAIAAFTSAQKGSGKTKPSQKPICRDFLTDNGCPRGGQCTFQNTLRLWAAASDAGPRNMQWLTARSHGRMLLPLLLPRKGKEGIQRPTLHPRHLHLAPLLPSHAPKAKAGAQKRGQSQPKGQG